MGPSRFAQVEELYHAALVRKPDERSAFLAQACSGDDDLRSEVELLLAQDASGDSLLEGPASDVFAGSAVRQLPRGARLGAYQIESLLGAGGMGEVYLAHDSRLDRRVAIKLLPERLAGDAVARERLRREALAAAALDHPYICKIHEIGEDNGALFCVMEYARGETLFARLRAGRVELTEALRIAGEIAEAIEEAHANHFIHRDLKPGNIILTVQGHVKVMDFGLAKRVALSELDPTLTAATPLTGSGAVAGTPQYMSPEQATGGTVDHRSDLFSFGIILAELLTGNHPFQRNTALETVTAILRDPPDLATDVEAPPGLLVLIRRLLAKSPEERYASMRDVRADLAGMGATVRQRVLEAPPITLIGRDQERAAILGALDAALAGHGSLVLISGEPGIGKTHLTRAILADATRRGCFTVTGHCYEAEGAPPYVPFIEMLEYGVRALPRDAFRFALGDAAPEVAKLMPELRRIFPDIPAPIELPPEQQRRFLFNAYREFVERGAKVTPFVAVFEDLHWADESTLLLLQHLVQRLAAMPALLMGTYRDAGLDMNRPLARTVETLLREKLATQIPLRRLPLERTGELLEKLSGQAPPSSATRLVFDHTEGNPFFVESVYRHLAEEGRLFDQQGAWRKGLRSGEWQVPQGVRLVIGRRLERLTEEARRVLTTAAVIGRSFDLRLLEELESAQPDAALDAVEAAERARLVEAQKNGLEARYRFVHELIRQTLAESLSLPRRQRLHARVADAIERIYAANIDSHAPALAHHLYQAGAAAEAGKAVAWLSRAAQQAAGAAAFDEALAHLDNALSLLSAEQSARVAELHVQRATMMRSLGQLRDAVAGFERALALFEANGDFNRFAETAIPLALTHWYSVELQEALQVCRRALVLLTTPGAPLRVILQYILGVGMTLADDIDSAIPIFRELERIEIPQNPAILKTVAQMRTYQHVFCAEDDLAENAVKETNQLCAAAGDVWTRLEVAWMWALVATQQGRLEEGRAISSEAIPASEKMGNWATSLFCKQNIYDLRAISGDFEVAAEHARVLEEYQRTYFVAWHHAGKVLLGNVARWRGRVEEALEWCRQAHSPQPTHFSGGPFAVRALALAQAGDPRAGAATSEALRFVPRAGHPAPWGRWVALNMTIEALATAGRVEDAAALSPAAEDMVRRYQYLWGGQTLPHTTAGIAAACARNWPQAEEHHRIAIQQAEAWAHKVGQPIARYWYAEMLRMRDEPGDYARARQLLSEALAMCESLGMPLYARQAGEKLASSI